MGTILVTYLICALILFALLIVDWYFSFTYLRADDFIFAALFGLIWPWIIIVYLSHLKDVITDRLEAK